MVLEETVKRSVENTNISSSTPIMQPNTPVCASTQESISENAHPDDTCYHLENYDKESIAVIIEAKLVSNAAHVEAQVSW